MNTVNKLQIGDVSDNGQVTIIDEDRLCYLVKSESRGSVGLRTISKSLLEEYINYFEKNPNANANIARDTLSGRSDIDKFEYGYSSTLTIMAKMAIEGTGNIPIENIQKHVVDKPLQQIYYGAPGTGKSHEIKELTEGKLVIRTTFHPDSDYSTFVGAYKPTTKEVPMRDVTGKVIVENGKQVTEDRIVYEFVEQAFLQAYIKAWKQFAKADEAKAAEKVYLVIEEINRGNCAQIFGDLFQLLDRGENGFSEYPINADKDLQKQLAKAFDDMPFLNAPSVCGMSAEEVAVKIRKGEIMVLPNNLFIWATMNTSDQSLFPIDSAFKRRWDWKYIKIKEGKDENGNKLDWKVDVKMDESGTLLPWWDFIKKINEIIASMTSSADKQLGYFFCRAKDGVIDEETFVSKVIFYLWNDVFKDFGFEDASLFRYTDKDGREQNLTFPDFYDKEGEKVDSERLTDFVKKVMSWKNDNNKDED